MYFTFLQKL